MIRLPPDVSLEQTFTVTHDLSDHALLSSEAIEALATRLPPGSAEPGPTDPGATAGPAAGGPLVANEGLEYQPAPRVDAAPAVAALEGRPQSIYLYNVERDPEVGSLALGALGELYPQLGVDPAEVTAEEVYVFLSGGPSTTATHVDHELNFLLVIRGHKRVFIADIPSPEAEIALEVMHRGHYGTCAAVPARGREFEIGPGEGIFIPPRAAHYVVNGEDQCVALSIVFGTKGLDRQSDVYRANAMLRRVGMAPQPPGTSPIRDRAKVAGVRVALAAKRALRAVSGLRPSAEQTVTGDHPDR